jgi:hypothetical protein
MSRGINTAQLLSLDYSPDTKVLDVRFMRVGHYEYNGVPLDVGTALMTLLPEDAVALFDSKVEGTYKSTRLGP